MSIKMPWYFPWSDSIKKRACRYLLQHYLGQFLQEKLTLDQLSVDLYKGTGTICDLNLDVISLNKCLDGLNVPIEIVDGFVKSITAAIPWSTLTSDNTVMEISGLELTLRSHDISNTEGMNLDSMFSSMTTSMQLAQECLRQDSEGEVVDNAAQPMEGLEMFAQTIESVLSRIKVTLLDTVIRLEHIPSNEDKGVAFEVRIKRIEYFDDQATADANVAQPGGRNVYEPAAICYKNFYLMGVTFYADQFPESQGYSSYLRESMMTSVKTGAAGVSFIESTHADLDKTELIQIATLTGRQEMKVKVKQCDAVPGPKLEVNINFGSVHSILSPKYVHILINLVRGFESKEGSYDSIISNTVNKPMGSFDFERVENELQKQFRDKHRAQITTNMLRADFNEDEELNESLLEDGMYYSMHQSGCGVSEMTSSTTSACSSGSANTSTTNSSVMYNYGTGGYHQRESPFSAQRRKIKPKSNVQKLLDDPRAEVTRYKVKFSFFSLLLLHEDPPDTPSDGIEPGESGYEKLKKLVDSYLSQVVTIPVHGMDTALDELRSRFSQACSHDHLALLSKPITVECELKTSSSGRLKSTVSAELSVGCLEIVETLYERNFGLRPKQNSHKFEHSELLVFHLPDVQDLPSLQTTPCLRLKLVDYETTGRDRPVTDISVQLAPVFSEVDITLVDRIHSLLDPPSHSNARRCQEARDKLVSVSCSSSLVTLDVRFPIPDLRSGNAVDKLPWWKKTVHREILTLELSDLDFKTKFDDGNSNQVLEFSAFDVHALFKDDEPVSFLRAGHGGPESDDLVKMTITISPVLDTRLSEEREESDDSIDLDDSTCHVTVDPDPTPFSTSKIIHDNEEIIIPGDKQQMDLFREKSMNNTLLLIDIHVPNLNARLPSRQFYELLYNRINSDLLLWVPQAPSPITAQHSAAGFQSMGYSLASQAFYECDEYLPCKSGTKYESSSDSEDESLGPEHMIYNHDMKRASTSNMEKCKQTTQNQVCLGLTVGFGKLSMQARVKDDDEGTRDDVCGQFLVEVEDGSLFMVDSAKRVTSMSVQANRAALYHDGNRPVFEDHSSIGRATVEPTDLHPVIYKSDPGIPCKTDNSLAMISIALRITPAQLSAGANSKEFLLALGIHGSTLRHRMTESRYSWFTQINDFLDVRDFPIRGYTLPKLVTVLHLHTWSCAVDYRPLHLPFRCLVTVENFSVSSNIIAKSMTNLLKFMVEDGTISLSHNLSSNEVNVHRDYVCVVEVGLFELTLQTSDGRDWKYPKTDLKASSNIIHIRTCADSCLAVRQLLLYLTNYGDLAKDAEFRSCTPDVEASDAEIEEDHLQHVHDLMADAMKDTAHPVSENSRRRDSLGNPTQVFFFPDEHLRTADDPPASAAEFEDEDSESIAADDEDEFHSDDEEFCIIDDPGMGISPRDGEPTVRTLVDQPLVIKENHFTQPLGRADLLRAPESFPNAVYRYTLKEMSLVWHMYGGEDFRRGKTSQITMVGQKVAFGKPPKVEKSKLPWHICGGPFRDHSTLLQLHLNKVRLQHEIYPETTPQASRQIFLVHELEIHDKLSSSQINKFLYQYTCDQMPKQSRANMILVKNVHMRPDVRFPNTQECSMKISLLPLRFNIDQDSLMFLRAFLQKVNSDEEYTEPCRSDVGSIADQASSPPKSQPIMGSPCQKPIVLPDKVRFDEFSDVDDDSTESTDPDAHLPTYFKTFVFSPDVLIRFDYHGKRLTTIGEGTAGTATGLLAGLAQLNCSEFRLKRIHYRHGLLGIDRVFLFALNEWLSDIKKNQLPSILGGVGPMHTVLQLFQGVKDLFWLPVEQYRKDGRLFRGIQRGANSFTTSTLMAALELTNRSVQSIQYVAEFTYDMVSPNLSVRRRKQLGGPTRRQPGDFREGVNSAYQVLKEGFSDTANTIIQAAQKEHNMRGVTGAVGGVLRQIPPTVVQPLILATEATSNVLGGMRNQLLPDVKREEDEKWKQAMD